jgi:hypothetical protein
MARKPMARSGSADFRRCKSRAAELLVHRGIPAGPWSPERDLRQMYIRGATPEQAAEQVQAGYWNARSFERMGKSRK